MSKEKAAQEALKRYEELMEALTKKAKEPGQKLEGYGAQSWVDTVNASHALHAAENDAITAKYDPMIEKARADLDQIRQESHLLSQKHDEHTQEYRNGDISYEQYIEKVNKVKEEYDENDKKSAQAGEVFDNVRSARRKELDDASMRAQQRYATLQGHSLKPKKEAPDSTVQMGIKDGKYKNIIEDYFKKFEKDDWYKGRSCSEKDGKLTLPFKNNQDLTDFCRDQAAKNRNFTIIDGATNKVMAYSQDGKFFHANGKEVKDGDSFTPSDKTLDQFKIPTPSKGVEDSMSKVAKAADSVLPSSKRSRESAPTDSPEDPLIKRRMKGESHGGPTVSKEEPQVEKESHGASQKEPQMGEGNAPQEEGDEVRRKGMSHGGPPQPSATSSDLERALVVYDKLQEETKPKDEGKNDDQEQDKDSLHL